jgi:DNA-binding PadR family transcriptional regulator
MAKEMELLQGTLDMLILKAISLGPLHGYGVLLRISDRFNSAQIQRSHWPGSRYLQKPQSHAMADPPQ